MSGFDAVQERKLTQLERKHGRVAAKNIRAEGRAFIKAIRTHGIDIKAAELAVEGASDWLEFASDAQTQGVEDLGRIELANAKASGRRFHIKQNEEILLEGFAAAYAAEHAAEAATLISDTSKKAARLLVSKALSEGWTTVELASAARVFYGDQTINRSIRLARTELVGAANFGTQAAAEATGLEHTKTWSSALTATTRQTHRDADGQTVRQGESFNIGGEMLAHPGDPLASAGNRINCLCGMKVNYE